MATSTVCMIVVCVQMCQAQCNTNGLPHFQLQTLSSQLTLGNLQNANHVCISGLSGQLTPQEFAHIVTVRNYKSRTYVVDEQRTY